MGLSDLSGCNSPPPPPQVLVDMPLYITAACNWRRIKRAAGTDIGRRYSGKLRYTHPQDERACATCIKAPVIPKLQFGTGTLNWAPAEAYRRHVCRGAAANQLRNRQATCTHVRQACSLY
jgi:hypothetical protein